MNAPVFAVLRRPHPIALMILVAASFAPVCALAGDPSPAATEPKAAASAPGTAAVSGDKWRFVWHNDQWWYYQPSGQWLIYDGSAWHAPQAVTATAQVYQPAQTYGGNQSQPRYRQFMSTQRQGGGMDNDGFWGNSPRYWTYQHVLKGR